MIFIKVLTFLNRHTFFCWVNCHLHLQTLPRCLDEIFVFLNLTIVFCTSPLHLWCELLLWSVVCLECASISYHNYVSSLGNDLRKLFFPNMSNFHIFHICTRLLVHAIYKASRELAYHPTQEVSFLDCK